MPWTVDKVEEHKSGLDQAGKEKWVEVANSALASCLKDGKDQKYCEGYAIRVASGATEAKAMELYIALSDPGKEEFTEHKIFYPGKFKHGVYGEFDVDEKKLTNAVENFNSGVGVLLDESGGKELNCTYEHPPASESDPEKTKSSGRIKKLFLKDGALYALIRWTEKAKEYIKNKEFTHVSPAFQESWTDEIGKKRGFTVRGLGLTNAPFLKQGQMAIALSDTDSILFTKQEDTMDQKIHEILELKEDGNVAEAVKELKDKAAKADEQVKNLTKATEKVKTLETQVKELTDKLEKSKPKDGEVKLTETELKELKDGMAAGIEAQKKLARNEAEKLIDKALSEGKLIPVQRESMIERALKDPDWTKDFLSNASKVIDFKEHGSAGDGLNDSTASLVKKIEAYAAEKKIGFTEAKRQLKEQNPAEFKEAGY